MKHPPAWTRRIRRLWRPFLSRIEKQRILAAIAEQENLTTGKIHVQVIARCGKKNIMDVAKQKFHDLKLENAGNVLILVSHLDHQFAILGDERSHTKAGEELWNRAKETLITHFAERKYAHGIESCVREIGKELARHFPKPKQSN